MRILYILPVLLLLIGGCTIRPKAKPPITQYYLQPSIEIACISSPIQKVVRLNFVNGLQSVSQQNIIYTKSDLQAGSYLYGKWNQLPTHSISTALYTALQDNKVFSKLVFDNSFVHSDLTLDIKIMQFEHHFVDDNNSYGLLTLNALLYDSQTKSLLASQLFKSEIKASSNDAQGGVEALNIALGDILSKLICWSKEKISQQGA